MSGPVCPDCSSTYIKHIDGIDQCEICGWEGELGDERAWLTEEGYAHNAKQLALRKAGKLFYIRVWTNAPDVIFDVMKVLGVHGASSQGNVHRIELSEKPSEEVVEKVRKVKGVTKVTVF